MTTVRALPCSSAHDGGNTGSQPVFAHPTDLQQSGLPQSPVDAGARPPPRPRADPPVPDGPRKRERADPRPDRHGRRPRRFLYRVPLERDRNIEEVIPTPKQLGKLPSVPGREENLQLLACVRRRSARARRVSTARAWRCASTSARVARAPTSCSRGRSAADRKTLINTFPYHLTNNFGRGGEGLANLLAMVFYGVLDSVVDLCNQVLTGLGRRRAFF